MPQDTVDQLSSGLTESALNLMAFIENMDPSDPDTIEVWAMMKALSQKMSHIARDFRAAVDDAGIGIVKAQGEFNIGSMRYYVGDDRKVRQIADSGAVADAIMNEGGGDLDAVYSCLGSNPWKQGTIKKLVGEEVWKHLFSKEPITKLKEGTSKEGLRCVDLDFIKRLSAKESNNGDTDS